MLHTLSDKPSNEWSKLFKDWNFMSIRDDIIIGKDFVLVSQTSWLKLVAAFGGAPEIPIF